MDTLNFNFVFLGQSVLRYEVPLDVYSVLNHVYETKRNGISLGTWWHVDYNIQFKQSEPKI